MFVVRIFDPADGRMLAEAEAETPPAAYVAAGVLAEETAEAVGVGCRLELQIKEVKDAE